MPDQNLVGNNETVARFLLKPKWWKGGVIHRDAFVPPGDLEFSVTRSDELDESALWRIGEDSAEERRQNARAKSNPETIKLVGRGDLSASKIRGVNAAGFGLNILPNPLVKNIFHAKIVGWPSWNDDTEEAERARNHFVNQLARLARYVPLPPGWDSTQVQPVLGTSPSPTVPAR